MLSKSLLCFGFAILFPFVSLGQPAVMEDAGEPFGPLRLIDEVIIGLDEESHGFVESEPGVSEIQTILGQETRVLPNVGGARFFGYRLGVGKDLVAGKAYVLSVEYPEDAPRTVFVVNRGAEYARGFSTGTAIGDSLQNYTNSNTESLPYPLSGLSRTWKTLFHLHEQYPAQALVTQGPMARPETPANGFMVYIAQLGTWGYSDGSIRQAPLSLGAAISRIRLFEAPDQARLVAPINYPPASLPRRHLFWREEMSDGAVSQRNNQAAFANEMDWFENKAKLMQFLGMNTYSKDLLEFGANQGWDSNIHGGNSWVHQSDNPQRWSQILDVLEPYDFYVLPMYEYCGSKGDNGLGYQTRARPLRRDPYVAGDEPCKGYTHIWWAENCNVDVVDPDTYEDLRKMLDATLVRHRDRARFLGAWIRTRNSDLPISFSDLSLARFTSDTEREQPVTRQQLIDEPELLENYKRWWLEQRRALLARARAYLKEELDPQAVLLFTAYFEEPGPGIGGGTVTDDVARFESLGLTARPWHELATNGAYLEAALTPPGSWDEGSCMDPVKRRYEWEHAGPRPDPQNAKDMEGFLFTYPFNRLYTVSDPAGFEAFRGPAGLALIRHYSLNENAMNVATSEGQDDILGYFVSDVDRAGPYGMLAEARALANGDPRYIGYLAGHSYNRGFPEYVRAFNTAFLALPAIPSERLEDGSDHENVVVRRYPTENHGTYFAVINTGMNRVEGVSVNISGGDHVVDVVAGERLDWDADPLVFDLYPGEVRVLLVTSAMGPDDTRIGGEIGLSGSETEASFPRGGAPSVDESNDNRASPGGQPSLDAMNSEASGGSGGCTVLLGLDKPMPPLLFVLGLMVALGLLRAQFWQRIFRD